MPIIVNVLLSLGVLWALLIIFNEGGNFKYVQQEAMMIIGVVAVVGFFVSLLVPALVVVVVQAVALFFCVEHIGQLSLSATVRVTAWNFGIMILITIGFGGWAGFGRVLG